MKEYGIRLTTDNIRAIKESNLIVIAVKPYNIVNILERIKDHLNPKKHILISIIAGVTISQIQEVVRISIPIFRAMIQGGIQIGFDARTASAIVNQTVKGAAELLIERQEHPEFEIDKVTTPKGCTIVGLNEMEHNGFSSSLIKGIVASYEKIEK